MAMLTPFLTLLIAVILIVSVLFFTRNKIGAAVFSAIDIVIGLILIGSKEIVASIFIFQIPETVILYIGVAMTVKGVYYLMLSLR